MTETKNICEDFVYQVFIGKWIKKLVQTENGRQSKVIHLFAFFIDASLSASNTLKKMFAKKSSKKVIDKNLLNNPQATDKAKSRAEIGVLLACFN
jgi:hypothetical protein